MIPFDNETDISNLPNLIEAVYLVARETIYPGEELFTNYGDLYWGINDDNPVIQPSVKHLAKNLNSMLKRMQWLEEAFDDICKTAYGMETVKACK